MLLSKPIKLVISVIACELIGVLGSVFTIPAIASWYNTLQKPSFTPPSWLFGPIWIVLYVLMGISVGLVWHSGSKKKATKCALVLFDLQLALNVLWSFLFFGLRSPLYGLIDIIALWIAIAATMLKFYKISKTAALLMLPYLVWVSVALALNFYIFKLN